MYTNSTLLNSVNTTCKAANKTNGLGDLCLLDNSCDVALCVKKTAFGFASLTTPMAFSLGRLDCI